MYLAYATITAVTIAINGGMAVADLAKADFVLANSARVGVPASWARPLGTLKGAGAVGLLLGLLGVLPIGIAAATGLVLYFVGAMAVHIKTRVFANIAFPAAYLALAVASLALAVAR